MLLYVFAIILTLTVLAYFHGSRRAASLSAFSDTPLHSRPAYHGAYVAIWAGLPSQVLVLLWVSLETAALDALIAGTLPDAETAALSSSERGLIVSEIKSVARGLIFGEPAPFIVDAAARYGEWQRIAAWCLAASAISLVLLGLAVSQRRITALFRARHRVERVLNGTMVLCSLAAIVTTFGIVISLAFEAFKFFQHVPISEFLFGLSWEPQIAIREDQVAGTGAFGAIPVFAGTFLISAIAMIVAVPVGLMSAVYLSEFARPGFRAIVKPLLEILAGVPTVVYGFFAVLVIAPALKSFGGDIGLPIASNSALAAGLVMGIMIIPFISSLSDDALRAVPQAMREGSLGLGATRAETVLQVLLPAALPGIMGGILLAASRAIGETMIVVMAAGLIATLTLDPLQSVTTVTVQIVTLLTGDTEFDSPKTLAAFALGLTLFVMTLCLNVAALRTVQKYREKYD